MASKIEFIKVFSWYDVYVDGVMVLHHLSETDANELIDKVKVIEEDQK